MKTYIKGNYRKSIFKSDKGYVIGLFKVRETNKPELDYYVGKTITFTGYFHELNEDDVYIFYGEETTHPRYGFQFNVSEYERVKPTDKEGIIEFLASDLFPGVGEKLARTIVETLGQNALEEILKDASCLSLVPKLTQKKASKIANILKQYEESHQIVVTLTDLGFSMKDAMLIYNHYKEYTKDVINKNIYKLIDDILELTFSKVDQVAQKQGIDKNDKRRIKALIIYTMSNLTFQNGDIYLTKEIITNSVNNSIGINITSEEFDNYFEELKEEEKIIIEDDAYYLIDLYKAESNVASKIYDLSIKEQKQFPRLIELINKMEKENGISYNDKQKEAIKKALQSNILIITGGPGTGKTTIIKAITEAYASIHKLDYDGLVGELALLAPTGRASKRMSESTLLPASTIHRFLKWNKDTGEFMINETNKAKNKLIIIDEVSMIDIALFDSLFKGLTSDIQLILVGDYNQLPSVGPGQVLKDLIESDVIDTIHLDHLYRQDENSYIPTLASEIKEGNLSESFLETKSDYTFLQCTSASIKKNLQNLCMQVIEKGYDYKRVQLLAPMYKGENGIDLLNKELQDVFNPKDINKREITSGDVIFRENDKILQLVNMPDDNIYNGDIGVIKYIKYGNTSKSKKNEIYVDFDGNLVKYTPKDFNKIKHGFIISIHKSQGSEFEMVIMPVSQSYSRMLYRKLIYTGITRAKKKLILIGEVRPFTYSVYNNNEYIRNSKLLEKIMNKFEK